MIEISPPLDKLQVLITIRDASNSTFHLIGLPPKKESSFDVRLELKIKGVNHGQEIAFFGADHHQAA